MNVFNKRPLGLILCVVLCGFSLFSAFDSFLRGTFIIITSIFLVAAFFVKPISHSKLPKIAAIALLCSFIMSYLYFDVSFYPEKYYDKEITATGTVNDYETDSEYLKTVDFHIETIDGKGVNYNVLLYLYGYSDISEGDTITVKTKLTEFAVGENFDFRNYYTSRGFSAKCSASEYILEARGEEPLLHKLSRFREAICQTAVNMAGADAGGLLGAVLLGERNLIPNQLNLDFQRIGIIHILSLSGMHLSILTAVLDKLLYIIRFKRKARMAIGCVFSLLFMALTGFPITVCRAGIMLIISSVLTLVSGNKDSITSLAIAGTLIVVIQPYSALDLGFWLSLLSTFGILIGAEMFGRNENEENNNSIPRRIGRILIVSAVFSLFAICSSMLITALSFDYISLTSILNTFIFSFLIEIFLYLGIAMLLFGNFIPIAPAVEWLSSLISSAAAMFSDLPFVYVSSSYTCIKILAVALSIIFFAFIILKIKHKTRYVTVICLLFVFLMTLSATLTAETRKNDSFVTASDDGDKILIFSDSESLLFDASEHKNADGYNAVNFLAEEHVSKLDCYFVPNYTDHLPEMLDVLLSRISVENVALPIPVSESERAISSDVYNTTMNYRTEIYFYDSNGISFGSYEILKAHSGLDNAFTFVFKTDDKLISYLTSGALDDCYDAIELLYVSNSVIFGRYGSGYEQYKMIDDYAARLKNIISYDANLNFDYDFAAENSTKIHVNSKRVILN